MKGRRHRVGARAESEEEGKVEAVKPEEHDGGQEAFLLEVGWMRGRCAWLLGLLGCVVRGCCGVWCGGVVCVCVCRGVLCGVVGVLCRGLGLLGCKGMGCGGSCMRGLHTLPRCTAFAVHTVAGAYVFAYLKIVYFYTCTQVMEPSLLC